MNSSSSGNVTSLNINAGGFVGKIGILKSVTMGFSDCVHSGVVSGKSQLGGFIGSFDQIPSAVLTLTKCVNSGNITGSDTDSGNVAGGFVGCISNNNLNMTISDCVQNGSITGRSFSGGLVGRITSSSYVYSCVLAITNTVSGGTISASGNVCGMFCVDSRDNYNVNTSVYNSISMGNVNAGAATAYGITNNITEARNVVSMGKVIGSSQSHSFWGESTDADLFYGLKTECKNCVEDGATVFVKNERNGLYTIDGSGERVDEKLNKQTENQGYGAMWTFDLSLSTNYVNVTVGKPVNGYILVDSVKPLEQLSDLCGVFMGTCTIVDQKTKMPINEPIFNDTMISFCFQVSVSGIVKKTLYVEMDTQMKDIGGLSAYFNKQYEVKNADDKTTLYDESFVVSSDMNILVVNKLRVTFGSPISTSYYVHPGDTLDEIRQKHRIPIQFDDFIVIVNGTKQVLYKTSTIGRDT